MIRIVMFGLMLSLFLASCTGQDLEEGTPTPIPPTVEPTESVKPTLTPKPMAVNSLEDVKLATIRIEAEGPFVSLEDGLQRNSASTGSGFIIDESGLAVTNNHVVTRAAKIKVYIEGESQPRNARVLGASECSDLALIQIDGDEFRYLDWYENDISFGLQVYAAGFPLGQFDFVLTSGTVLDAEANGDTEWSSIKSAIAHDATIKGGHSGGPLVNSDGQVVAVNYGLNSNTNQSFAIAQDEAQAIISQLRNGDVTSIGINGTAIRLGENSSGIWVSSVKSGSPADKTGIKAGDFIISMEGLELATDGSMSDYCDILRSHSPDDVMKITVIRLDTEQALEGQINGRELRVVEDLSGSTSTASTASTTPPYVTITDSTNQLYIEVPVEWNDLSDGAWVREGEEIGVKIAASPDLDAFYNSWGESGVFFSASGSLAESMNEQELLDTLSFSSACEYDGRYLYEDGLYSGYYDQWINCGDQNATLIVIAAMPEDRSFIALLQVQLLTEVDDEVLERIINSFIVSE